jgi:heme A synthase
MAKRFPNEFLSFFELYPRRVGYLKQEERDRAINKKNNKLLVRYTIFGSDPIMLVSIISVGSLYALALIGIYAMWRTVDKRRDLSLFVMLVLSFAVGYATSWGKIRYRIPVDPYIILLSAWGVVYVWGHLSKKFLPARSVVNEDMATLDSQTISS